MITKKSYALTSLFLSGITALSLPSKSFGFGEFARGGVTLDTEAALTYDSFFVGASKLGDDEFYATLHPQLKYVRKAGLAEINGFIGVSVIRYNTYTRYNSEDFSAGLQSKLPVGEGSRLSGSFDLEYSEAYVVDPDIFDRIRTKSFSATAQLRYALGLKTSLEDSISFNKVLRGEGYSNQDVFSNAFSFVYANFLDETTLRLTHTYTRTTSSGDNFLGEDLDQSSNAISAGLSRPIFGPVIGEATYGYHILNRSAQENLIGQDRISGGFFSVSIHGPFLPPSRFPKLQSSASITYQDSISPGINDYGGKTLTGDISLSWDARDRTKVSIHASRVVGLNATDLSVETTRVSLDVNQSVGYSVSIQGELAYDWRSYRNLNRNDGTFEGKLSTNYAMNRYWSAGASYDYQNNTTNNDKNILLPPAIAFRMRALNYDRHLVTIYIRNVF